MCWNILLVTWVATAIFTSAQEPDPEVDCSSVSYGFFSLTDDCTKFVFCNNEQTEEFSCRDDEIWSQEIGACLFGDPETCQEWSPEVACSGNTTGIKVPHPRDCGKFVLCGVNGPNLQDCELGRIFEKDRCVVGNLEQCESYEPMCDGKDNEKLEHPDRCDAFIKCDTLEIALEVCPEDEIFQIDTRRCILGDLEACEPLPIEEMCEKRVNQMLVHPGRCESFVYCKEGEGPIEEDCPRGMIFNSRSLSCEVGDLDTCELLDQVCVNTTVGEVLEHPNGCDIHINCLDKEIPQIGFCPFGRIWRQDMMMCVPGNQISCERAPIESMCDNQPFGTLFPHPDDCSVLVQCSITKAIEIPCSVHHIIQPGTLDCILGDQKNCTPYNDFCIGKLYQKVALPDTCDAYILCHNENPELNYCPPGDILNATLGRCSPGDIDTCEFLECTDSDSVSRHPNYCNIFTRCSNGQISTQFCQFEHIFHETMKRCTPGNVTGCEYESLEEMCKGRFSDTVYPYPSTANQCTEYVLCMDDEAKIQSCPQGMVLRPEHLDCVPGDEQNCEVFDMACAADEESVIVHPSRCDMKIICNNGIFAVELCPSGETVDPVELSCIPGSCGEPTPVNDCIGKPDGAYEYSDCNRYVVCTNEEMSIVDCPTREIFLASKGVCFPGLDTDCQPFPLEFMCEERENGSTHPDLENCSQFITCNNNQANVALCARGNIYSPSHKQCLAGASCELIDGCETTDDGTILLHPAGCDLFVECKERLAHAKECPLEHIITIGSNSECVPGDLNSCTTICDGLPIGTLLPHVENCTNFYECRDDATINLNSCPSETIFNQQIGDCTPGDVETCVPVENQCIGRPDGQYEYVPSDCSRYIICRDESMTVENCPAQEIFLSTMGICFPGTVVGCATFPPETMCDDRAEESIYPVLDDCTEFITCINNQAIQTPCGRGNIYSPIHGKCIAGSLDCLPIDMCLSQEDGSIQFYPGEDCELFIRCESQLSRAEECPTGEIITSDTDGRCVPGNSATCTPNPEDIRFMSQPSEKLLTRKYKGLWGWIYV